MLRWLCPFVKQWLVPAWSLPLWQSNGTTFAGPSNLKTCGCSGDTVAQNAHDMFSKARYVWVMSSNTLLNHHTNQRSCLQQPSKRYTYMQTFVICMYWPLGIWRQNSSPKVIALADGMCFKFHQHDWSYQATFLALDVLKSNDQEVPATQR